MKNHLTLFLFLFPFFIFSQQKQSSADKYSTMYQSGVSAHRIMNKLERHKKKWGYEKSMNTVNALIIKSKREKEDKDLVTFLMGKVDLGCRDIMILEDSNGIYLRQNHPDLYKQLEQHLSQKFIAYCQKYFPHINMELTLVYRYLERFDQRYLMLAQGLSYPNDRKKLDSLRILFSNQDTVSETMLENIFETYGIPGIKDVGPEVNGVSTFFLHLSPKFVFKWIGALQRGIKDKRISISEGEFEFIVDKTLHKCCHKMIYGTSWSKYSPLVKDPKEVKRIKEKLGIE